LYLIVGLGNPGREYLFSRHNLGFMVVDRLAGDLDVRVARSQFDALAGDGTMSGSRVLLAKPQTYMNLSGNAVSGLLRFYKLEMEHLIVIHDDLDLQFDTVRIKKGGGHGGNKGVMSIMERLGSPDFIRVRIGIGKPPRKEMTESHVLSRFSPEEMEKLPDVLARAADAVEAVVKSGLAAAMNRFNRKPAANGRDEDAGPADETETLSKPNVQGRKQQ
jgi:PTH1 family peptidyl-tRNA hydrolase